MCGCNKGGYIAPLGMAVDPTPQVNEQELQRQGANEILAQTAQSATKV